MAMNTVPNPVGMTWEDWRDTVIGFNREIRNYVDLNSDWRTFADNVTLAVPKAPNQEYFESWQTWGNALRNAINF